LPARIFANFLFTIVAPNSKLPPSGWPGKCIHYSPRQFGLAGSGAKTAGASAPWPGGKPASRFKTAYSQASSKADKSVDSKMFQSIYCSRQIPCFLQAKPAKWLDFATQNPLV